MDFVITAYNEHPNLNLEVFVHKADVLTEEYKIGQSSTGIIQHNPLRPHFSLVRRELPSYPGSGALGLELRWRRVRDDPDQLPAHLYIRSFITRCVLARLAQADRLAAVPRRPLERLLRCMLPSNVELLCRLTLA